MEFSFKKISIEAPFPTTQCGHSCQTELIYEFKDHLFARATGLKQDDTWIIHLSLDLLAYDLEHKELLENKLRDYYKNDKLILITSTTHTHYANSVRTNDYLDWLIPTLFEGITSMEYETRNNVSTSYQRIHTNAVGKSRISGYETNNENLCLIRFYDDKENFFNIVINNCHPTVLFANVPFFSAEYPGYVLKLLEEEYHTNFTFIQGAAGDISSRFVRDGQTYEDMVKLATNLFLEAKELINKEVDKKPFKLIYNQKELEYKHDLSPVDTSHLRADLTERELETIRVGAEQRAKLDEKISKNIFHLIKRAIVSSLDLGSVKIVFYPNEIFSEYMNLLDLDKTMLVSYSNGYGPYILPIDFPYVTYEMFMDTLTKDTKQEIMETIKTI